MALQFWLGLLSDWWFGSPFHYPVGPGSDGQDLRLPLPSLTETFREGMRPILIFARDPESGPELHRDERVLYQIMN
jgi:hypothetical protein